MTQHEDIDAEIMLAQYNLI